MIRPEDIDDIRECFPPGFGGYLPPEHRLILDLCDALEEARDEAEGLRDFIDEVHGGEPIVLSWEAFDE